MMSLLLLGFWKLQIVESDRYDQLAEQNRVRTIPVIAPRGTVLDRGGRVLVDNYPSFSVLLLRDDVEQVERLLPQIADGMSVPLEELREALQDARALPRFQPIVIKPEASPADIAFIESHRADIPVLEMLMVHRRRYPAAVFMAHVSGYARRARLALDSVNSVGREEGRLEQADAIPGKPILLALDYALQAVAERALTGK